MNRYIVALQDNTNNCFEPTLPQVSAFSIFNIADLPNESDPGFEDYGQAEIKIISNHFYGTKEEEEKKMKSAKLLAQCENFKFEMVAWKKQVPQTLLQPNDRSPEDINILTTTDWTLQSCLRGVRPTRIPIQNFLWWRKLHGRCPLAIVGLKEVERLLNASKQE